MKYLKSVLLLSIVNLLMIISAYSFEMSAATDAPDLYKKRMEKPLSPQEKSMVGKYQGAGDGISYEIEYKKNGTYNAVFTEKGKFKSYIYFAGGVWRVEGGVLYEQDLIGAEEHMGMTEEYSYQMKTLEDGGRELSYKTEDGELEVVKEKPTKEFSHPMWKKVKEPDLDQILSKENMTKIIRNRYLSTLRTLNISNARMMMTTLIQSTPDDIMKLDAYQKFETPNEKLDWIYHKNGVVIKGWGRVVLISPKPINDSYIIALVDGSIHSIPAEEMIPLIKENKALKIIKEIE